MSGYEALASTQMLATHCAVCHRALRDALSIERGIGPDCAEKYGYAEVQVTEEARVRANYLIYLIGDLRMGPSAIEAAQELRVLGFEKLADILLARLVPLRLERLTDDRGKPITLRFFNEYDPAVTERLKHVPGRWFNGAETANEFPYSSAKALWAALRELYPGKKMLGPDGKLIAIEAPRGVGAASGFGDVDY